MRGSRIEGETRAKDLLEFFCADILLESGQKALLRFPERCGLLVHLC